MKQRENRIDCVGIGELEAFDGLECARGLARLGTGDAESCDAVVAGSIGRLGGLEECALERAPELIGQ